MLPNLHFPADLVTFTEKNAKWKMPFFAPVKCLLNALAKLSILMKSSTFIAALERLISLTFNKLR